MKLTILRADEVEAATEHAAPVTVTGLRWSKRLSPADHALWMCIAELEAGATMAWPDRHGDEALYVFDGELDVAGTTCPAGGAVVVEADVPATATATTTTRVAHYGSWAQDVPSASPAGPPAAEGHRVHVVGPEGRSRVGEPGTVAARFFADAGCPTCRVSLFEVRRDLPRPGRPHSHSADEIIYIVAGTMHLGAHELGPGTALCIPGGVRYAEGSGRDGCTFLNYRRDVSDRTDFVKGEPPVTTLERSATQPPTPAAHVVDVHFG